MGYPSDIEEDVILGKAIWLFLVLAMLAITVVIVVLSYKAQAVVYSENCSQLNIAFEHYKNSVDMCIPLKPGEFLSGISFRGDYYCVQTLGRTDDEIAATENHEVCHELVYRNYEHFCDGVRK